MVSFSDVPFSLANAFETPVEPLRTGGLFRPSVTRLLDYTQKVYNGFGLDNKTAAFSIDKVEFTPLYDSLIQLEEWVKNDGVE